MTEKIASRTLTLTVKDRFTIPELLPERSNLVDQYLAKDIIDKIALSQEERESIGLKAGQGFLEWRDGATCDKDVEFTSAEINYLDRCIKQKSQDNQIHRDMLDTITKVSKLVQA